MRSRTLLRITVIMSLFFSNCFNNVIKRKSSTLDDDSQQDVSIEEKKVPVPADVQYTFLDTINSGNEIALTDKDFGSDSEQKVTRISSSHTGVDTRYRVQVFASYRIEAVREQQKQLENKLKEELLIGYEAPYYKLFAGSYENRKEAEKLLPKLKKLGYFDAWIVTTNALSENEE